MNSDIEKYIKEFPVLATKEWYCSGHRKEVALLPHQYYLVANQRKNFQDFYGIDYEVENELCINHNFYDDVQASSKFFEQFEEKLDHKPKYFETLTNKFIRHFSKIPKVYRKMAKINNYSELSSRQLTKIYRSFEYFYFPVHQYSNLWYQNERLVDLLLSRALKLSRMDCTEKRLLEMKDGLIAMPIAKKTFAKIASEEIRKLSKIAKKISDVDNLDKGRMANYPALSKGIKRYIKKFEWINSRFMQGDSLREEQVIELIVRAINDTDKKEEIGKDFSGLTRGMTKHSRAIVKSISEHIHLRTYRRELGSMLEYSFRPFFKALAAKMGLSYEEIINTEVSDLRSYIFDGLVPDREKIRKRMMGYDLLYLKGVFHVIERPEVEIGKNENKVKEIKGQATFDGLVRGNARVIRKIAELSEMQEGEIIVSSVLSPNYMVALKKAAGFVTDKGGILCHAAIFSRELKKPCIINTIKATDIINTGDLIELDTKQGLVKILNK